ncbi:uncharacterized protein BDV14DRAFT_183706 [Aspergillus stella-maris]|uniref:uncharacterized protein n=1 Tax=Aspergillus stella-maris TaxID=1810926 RepID=UPI003CCCB864
MLFAAQALYHPSSAGPIAAAGVSGYFIRPPTPAYQYLLRTIVPNFDCLLRS